VPKIEVTTPELANPIVIEPAELIIDTPDPAVKVPMRIFGAIADPIKI
jgi:hypothetical protein